MVKKKAETVEMDILEIKQSRISGWLLGTTPLIYNAMSEKVKQDLLNPPKTKNKAEREATLKHDPIEEFRNSVYRGDDHLKTSLVFPSVALKAAMATAALEIPGATKASIFRLLYIEGDKLPVYGTPELFMTVVRQAGMNRAPDIRTRAILRQWAIPFELRFITPNLSEKAVSNLIQAAGLIVGIGDFRQEKGKGNYGLFEVVPGNHKDVLMLQKNAGRKQQLAALENPNAYDSESAAMWEWFEAAAIDRGQKRATA